MDKDTLINDADKSIKFYTDLLKKKRMLLELNLQLRTDLLKVNLQASELDFQKVEDLIHFNNLLNIVVLELHVIFKHLLLSKGEWERAYFLKQVYLLVHETFEVYNNYNHLLNDAAKKDDSLSLRYRNIGINLKKFKKDFNYPKAFTDFRNTVVAHIDLVPYYDKLSSLKGDFTMNIVKAFTEIVNQLACLSLDIELFENQLFLEKNKGIDIDELKAKIYDLKLSLSNIN